MQLSLLTAVGHFLFTFATLLSFASAGVAPARREESISSTFGSLVVDLGYSRYAGFYNTVTGVNEWSGIRYAAPPIGNLRWQSPQPPVTNRSSIINAIQIPSQCPQSFYSNAVPGFALQFLTTSPGSEDCLYLSVFSPDNARNLPVLLYIHGGGYGLVNANRSLATIIKANNDGFLTVGIQYRLGAFGYLSSSEVNEFGVVNAGIEDQTFALKWVQKHIRKFGGDPDKVTVAGESAGAGSAMLQALGNGGTFGTSLFKNVIVASPYLPPQFEYNAPPPTALYNSFATKAGCGSPAAPTTTFQCLVQKDTVALQNASAEISASGPYGTWAFVPVTDGNFTKYRPTVQLLEKKLNGINIPSGNNANEGALFMPQNITTQQQLIDFVKLYFPLLTAADLQELFTFYPNPTSVDDLHAVYYATLGFTGPDANEMSSFGTGHQQLANNIYAETTFVCPSYWLAEAFSGQGRKAYKYQYSVPAGLHVADVSAYFGPPLDSQGPDLVKAFMKIWGNFVISGNPSISAAIAAGITPTVPPPNPITNWPPYTISNPQQINLNQTGGVIVEVRGVTFKGVQTNTTEYRNPGLKNNITIANGYTWEGNRGARCDFWRRVGARVPQK